MKKLALLFLLLSLLACGKGPVATTTGTPTFTTGLAACNGRNFPEFGQGGSSSCCPAGGYLGVEGEWHVFETQGVKKLAHRYLGKACTTETRIDGKTLNFYPCGAAKDPLEDPQWINGTSTTIFRPTSGIGCGYQVTNPDYSYPEPYSDQQLYPKVTATCPYTACTGDAIAAVKVTVGIFPTPPNVLAGARLGRVLSNPPGITLSGAGESSGLFPGDVTLIAEPTGGHVRAVFSGACNKAGEYGVRAECLVKLAPDPKVSVTFECEKGFTCGGGSKD